MAEKPKHKGTLLWSMGVVVLTFPIFLVFAHYGRPGSGRAAWISTGMILASIKARWDLRKLAWFWVVIAAIVAVHLPLILLVPWTTKWIPAVAIVPAAIADVAAILTLVQFVERRMPEVGAAR